MSEIRLLTLAIWLLIAYGFYDAVAHSDVFARRGEALPMSGGLPYSALTVIGLDAVRRKLRGLEQRLDARDVAPRE
ncbi:MAG: hypothetical protein FJ091_12730 [Deltaproteobacteria bacterium]|nr:hypothetical protein [Deltaproteobacteria bacterium]